MALAAIEIQQKVKALENALKTLKYSDDYENWSV